MAEKPTPQRIWLIAVATVAVGIVGAATSQTFHYAKWKASVSSTFLIQNEKTDNAIAILQSKTLRRIFPIYYILLLATTPFLVAYLRPRPLWISVFSIFILMIPMLWYTGKISYVACKLVDWHQIFPEWFYESRVDRPEA